MHILLPPSEAKAAGGRGRSLRGRLDDGPLGEARQRTTAALARLLDGDRQAAARALLLPDGVVDDALADNARVLDAPTTPALRRYTGVVYDGLAFATLTATEQRTAARTVQVFSGLFGVVRGDEPVPRYRVPGKAVLPGLGVASTFWRPVLGPVLDDRLRRGLVVDLRSGDYAAMWRPGPASGVRLVAVRVLSPLPRGGHGVVSFTSKLSKGRLAAALVRRVAEGGRVDTVEDVADAWAHCGGAGHHLYDDGRLDLHTS
ncbi:YaaA family protein [uncultured Jatrophihabitans sp.]|uniref:YaaA family protein n=1 Tax=uncultured Jatrophihabitans sp. TaxID=1610747 RepID=UPI0035C9A13A